GERPAHRGTVVYNGRPEGLAKKNIPNHIAYWPYAIRNTQYRTVYFSCVSERWRHAMEPTGKPFQMKMQDVQVGEPAQEGYLPVTLVTSRGTISYRYYEAPGARCGAIWVGGVGGGWDTPSRSLYFRLCHELLDASIASLRVRLRHPTILGEAILDVLAGINFLRSRGL